MDEKAGCTPDKCDCCTGCGGSIEKISLRVEWKHKGENINAKDIEESMYNLSSELAVSGVEVIYINNNFSPDIQENSSEFYINTIPLADLTQIPSDGQVTKEHLRKGIFQALLQNI